jgi:hypothetical protein
MRQAYEDAITLAGGGSSGPYKPLETFWVTGAGDDFEMHVVDTTDRVTVFVVVPGSSPRSKSPFTGHPNAGSQNTRASSHRYRADPTGNVSKRNIDGSGPF